MSTKRAYSARGAERGYLQRRRAACAGMGELDFERRSFLSFTFAPSSSVLRSRHLPLAITNCHRRKLIARLVGELFGGAVWVHGRRFFAKLGIGKGERSRERPRVARLLFPPPFLELSHLLFSCLFPPSIRREESSEAPEAEKERIGESRVRNRGEKKE